MLTNLDATLGRPTQIENLHLDNKKEEERGPANKGVGTLM